MEESPVVAFAQLKGVIEFTTACYVVYAYEHVLTFSDEVEAIWSRRFTLASLLFFTNRYLTYFPFIIEQTGVNLQSATAIYDPFKACDRCKHFVKYEGWMTIAIVANAEIILILRLYCLYQKSKPLLTSLMALLVAQIVLSAWAVNSGQPLDTHGIYQGCILTSKKSYIVLMWGMPALTDCVLFVLTLHQTMKNHSVRRLLPTSGGTLIDSMLRDGIWYFCVIFCVNLLNILFALFAAPNMKNSAATFIQTICTILINRMQLNLRNRTIVTDDRWSKRTQSTGPTMAFMTIDSLGEELYTWSDDPSTERQNELELACRRVDT